MTTRTTSIKTKWINQNKFAYNHALQLLGQPRARSMSPSELIAHIRSLQATPGRILGFALERAADTWATTEGESPFVQRLRDAALLAEAGELGEAPPPTRAARTREVMQSVVAPYVPKPYVLADPYREHREACSQPTQIKSCTTCDGAPSGSP